MKYDRVMSKILLITNKEKEIEANGLALKQAGFDVSKAFTCTEGWQIIQQDKPDVVILDETLSNENSFEFCRMIKSNPDWKDILIILFSNSSNSPDQKKKKLPADVDEYCPLPLDADEFSARVVGIIRSHKTERKLQGTVKRFEHLKTVLNTVRRINQLITKESDPYQLLKKCCDTLVKMRGYYTAWIARFDPSPRFKTAVHAGFKGHFEPILQRLQQNELTSCWEKTLEHPDLRVMNRLSEDCPECPLTQFYGESGHFMIRLEYENTIYGIISVSLPDELAHDPEEQSMFREIAADIAFALYKIELESKHEETIDALQVSEQFNKSIIDSSHDCIKVLDIEGRLQYMSPGGLDVMGIDNLQSFRNAYYPDLLQSKDKKIAEVALRKAKCGKIGRFQGGMPTPSGDLKWWDIIISPIFGKSGTPEKILAVSHDITDQIQSEQNLELQNRIANTFLTTTDEALYNEVLNIVLDVLESSYGYFGYIDEDGNLNCPTMTRHIWDQCQIPDKSIIFPKESWSGLWGTSLKSKTTLFANDSLQLPKGHVPLTSALAVPILYHDQLIGQFVVANKAKGYDEKDAGMLESIARHVAPILHARLESKRNERKRKEAEKALFERERQYREFIEGTDNLVTQVDKDGRFTFVNRAAAEIYGCTPEECLGRSAFDFIHPEDHEKTRASFLEWISNRSPSASFENRQLTKNGETRHLSWTINIHQDEYGNINHINSIAKDITELKETESTLEWESNVNATLADLANKLVKSQFSIDEIANLVLEKAKQLTESEFGYVSVIDPVTGDNLSFSLTNMMESCQIEKDKKTITFPKEKDGRYSALWGHALNIGKAFYTNSPSEHPSSEGIPKGHLPLGSFLSAPAMIRKELLGQIALANPARKYTDRDMDAVSRLADMYALAIQRYRVQNELLRYQQNLERIVDERTAALQKRIKQLVLSSDIGKSLTHENNIQTMLQRCAESVVNNLGIDFVRLWILNSNTHMLELKASAGMYTHLEGIHSNIPLGTLKVGKIAESQEPTLTNNVSIDCRINDHAWAARERIQSFAGYPLVVTGKTVGVIGMFARRPMEEDDIRMIESIADQIALGIDRKLTETALIHSEALYHSLVENLPQNIFRKDTNGRYTFVNNNFCDLLQKPWETIIGKTDFDIYPHEQAEQYRFDDQRVIESEQAIEKIEFYEIPDQHKKLYIQVVKTPLLDFKRKVIGIQGIFWDITKQKEAEEEKRSYQDKLEAVLKAVPLPMFAKEANGTYTMINPAFESFFGISANQLLGKTAKEVWPSQDVEVYQNQDSEIIIQDELQAYEYSLNNYANEQRHVIFTKSCFHDGEGRVSGIVGAITDITEQKRAEEALRKSNNLLDAISRAQAEFIAKSDKDSSFNVLLASLLKLTHSEYGFIGEVQYTNENKPYLKINAISDISWNDNPHSLYELQAPKGMEFYNLNTLFGEVLKTGKPVISNDPSHDPRRGGLPEGHPPLNSFMGIPFYFGQKMVCMVGIANRPDGYLEEMIEYLSPFLATCANIIEAQKNEILRREAEEKILQLNVELERRVLKRTEQLEAANNELQAFSYSVSHDLRAPLRAIDGFSRMLHSHYGEMLDERGQHYIERIRAGSERMARLIDALLDLSRMNRTQLHFEMVNLSEIVDSIAHDLQSSEPDRNIQFHIEPNITVEGDSRLLHQLLENLIRNAWKFTQQENPATIHFGVTIHNGKTAYFIKDNGVGFDMAYADKLFSPFQRLHSKEEFEGTGIGLATVQRIVHRHGGNTWAEGEVEKGATFYFTL